ncbi:FAD:protein FMN transferase [Clostridium sp. YIM B02515]|uniref:FAD:protein FMN transferase n=1 Tax=Clostridium rhizosphaerae TaxID=2803861 RepID=A0ABS1TFJ5_9CLOT|nr:FAD:protein FMN transferase [Clostridium rhizosphaerae]MBL4936743.1 FAD:protein FMN transferase [Clostridium rhizosphaerae]
MKKIISLALTALVAASVFTGCAKKNNEFYEEKNLNLMDTVVDLRASGTKATQAVKEAMKRLEEIDVMASPNNEKGDVWKINQGAGRDYVKVNPDTIKMIQMAVKYSKMSNGAFDITVSPLINLWGIGTDKARVPSDQEIKEKLSLVGYDKISIKEADNSVKLEKEGMAIDLGGIAKGFAADEVMKIFKKYNIENALIDLGGSSIYASGKNKTQSPWSIGIQHPRLDRSEGLLGIVKISDEALSTSGDYERFFIKDNKRYHHILNPATGYPADNGVMSDTIVIKGNVADANMQADILTTTVFVLGADKGMKFIESLPGIECAVTTTDNKLYSSSGFKKRLTDLHKDFTEVQ